MTTTIDPAADPLDAAEAANIADHSAARRAMIDSQLRTSGVNEPFVLKRMSQVARENFVPAGSRGRAYADRAIRLEDGGSLGAPLVQGMMLQEANPTEGDKAIVVDAGSGYLAELFKPLVSELTVLSVEDALGKGKKGKGANLLVVDGAIEELPKGLVDRLEDGARIVSGIVTNGVTRLAVGRKSASGVALIPVHDLGIPRISAFDKPKGWSF